VKIGSGAVKDALGIAGRRLVISFAEGMTTSQHDAASRPTGRGTGGDDGAWAIMLFTGALALTAFTCLDAAFVHQTGARLGLLTVAVAVIAERAADPRSALGCAVLAFALGNGFLQNHAGSLSWDASIDYAFTLGVLGATALGLSVGQIRLAWRRRQRFRPLVVLLRDAAPPGDQASTPATDGHDHPSANDEERAVTSTSERSSGS
jgi:hypothetical protein